MKTSVTLSISVVTTTESTGSRSISMAGSTSCRTAAVIPGGPSWVHMGLGSVFWRGRGRVRPVLRVAGRGWPRGRRDLQGLVEVDAIAALGPVAVDFGRVQAAHERQDLLAEHLAGYQDGEARRVRGDVRGGHHLVAVLHPLFGLVGHEVLAVAVVVGQVEGATHVPLGGGQAVAVGEAGVEAAEVRQRRGGVGEPEHR